MTPLELTSGTPSMVVCEASQVMVLARALALSATSAGRVSEPMTKHGFCLLEN